MYFYNVPIVCKLFWMITIVDTEQSRCQYSQICGEKIAYKISLQMIYHIMFILKLKNKLVLTNLISDRSSHDILHNQIREHNYGHIR